MNNFVNSLLVTLLMAYMHGKGEHTVYAIVSGQQQKKTKQNKGVCPFTSIIKNQTANARSPESRVCPCYSVDVNFDSFSLPKLYQHGILCLHVLMKRFTIFLRILSCQSSYIYFQWKLVYIFFCLEVLGQFACYWYKLPKIEKVVTRL